MTNYELFITNLSARTKLDIPSLKIKLQVNTHNKTYNTIIMKYMISFTMNCNTKMIKRKLYYNLSCKIFYLSMKLCKNIYFWFLKNITYLNINLCNITYLSYIFAHF